MDTETSDNAEQTNSKPVDHSTTDAAAKLAHDLVDRVAKVARDSEERIRQTADSAESSLQKTLSTARAKTSEAGDSLSDFVREHPFAALGIAFGTGVLLSYLTRGRAHYDDAE
jgi:ElaB/YqjD/DUF883 family membrane-anchored ribosome-binding protein